MEESMEVIPRAHRKDQDFKQPKREENHRMKVYPEYQERNSRKWRLQFAVAPVPRARKINRLMLLTEVKSEKKGN